MVTAKSRAAARWRAKRETRKRERASGTPPLEAAAVRFRQGAGGHVHRAARRAGPARSLAQQPTGVTRSRMGRRPKGRVVTGPPFGFERSRAWGTDLPIANRRYS